MRLARGHIRQANVDSRALRRARLGLDSPPDDETEVRDRDLHDHEEEDQLPHGPKVYGTSRGAASAS
jgi:hypothetical protein